MCLFAYAEEPYSADGWSENLWMHIKLTFSESATLNIASGSEVNITTPCEMEIFNFLWLIWDYYIPLAPTSKDRPP